MDSHVFRILALELKKYLHGARVEKIHSPAPGLLSITVYGHGLKRVLVMRHSRLYNHGLGQVVPLKGERQSPALYLSQRKLPNPEKPSTLVMTLRKYLSGKRLGAATIDWLNRRIFLPVPQLSPVSKSPFPIWLCLDLQNGPRILKELPEYAISDESPRPVQPVLSVPPIQPAQPAQPAQTVQEQNLAPLAIPRWPDFGLLAPDHVSGLQNRELWQAYPVLTPALRKTLACLEPLEAAALLADLEYEAEREQGALYLYEFAGKPHMLSAWPLPPELAEDLTEINPDTAISPDTATHEVKETPELADSEQTDSEPKRGTELESASEPASEYDGSQPYFAQPDTRPELNGLEAARLVYEPQVLASLGADARKADQQATSSEKRRLTKALQKLEQEEERLRKLAALREDAKQIQGALWQYSPDARLASIKIEEPVDGQTNACSHEIMLDPLKTLRENMAWLFKQSDRGERGLAFLKKRRNDLEAELDLVENGLGGIVPGGLHTNFAGRPTLGQKASKSDKSSRGKSGGQTSQKASYGQAGQPQVGSGGKHADKTGKGKQQNLARLVQRFTSSDGFTILRGRSAEGNWALLKLVQPHDIWLHVEGGPSAHVVIRREHLGQDIPRRTMLEAGTLSAVKSWRKNDSKAEIICALVKDVRPVKGGHPGSVLVDKIMEGFVVSVEPELENSLAATRD
ncbi:NFACT RNA binding domain-containing protein [Desulfovibrio sp. OttesenSCG-928-C06]|nr:NFACT RNA binding domain-containing protein [Desulfovibrio sp. OttesenSCG-928-C06]